MPGEEKEKGGVGGGPDGPGWQRAKESWYKGKGFLKSALKERGGGMKEESGTPEGTWGM